MKNLMGLILVIGVWASAATACGDSDPLPMDPETKAEYQQAQIELKQLSAEVMAIAEWTSSALRRMDTTGRLTAEQKRQLGAIIGEHERLSNTSRTCAGIMGAVAEVYNVPETEFWLAHACFSTTERFMPIAEAFLNERMPSQAALDQFSEATTHLQTRMDEVGYATD